MIATGVSFGLDSVLAADSFGASGHSRINEFEIDVFECA
jgi:hypothetical protein